MKDYLEEIHEQVQLEEGPNTIEQLLVEVHFNEGISTKALARELLIPLPLVSAIKKEFIKAGVLRQERGVRFTAEGKRYMEEQLGFAGLDQQFYNTLMEELWEWDELLEEEFDRLSEIYENRPQVDVTIDQSKCLPETGIKRALLAFENRTLIGKKILCVGDDDFISVSMGLLLKRLFPGKKEHSTEIHVVDVDERILEYIRQIAEEEGLPIHCHQVNLREPLPEKLHGEFDCFFTDPPYTVDGMTLFVSRGVSALKEKVGLPIFLSFAHKSPDASLQMLKEFAKLGLAISELVPRFNEYEGAEIIGNTSQMIVLRSTNMTKEVVHEPYQDAIYTGEVRRTVRLYQCKDCQNVVEVGFKGDYKTIEQLKNQGCPVCTANTFELIEKKQV